MLYAVADKHLVTHGVGEGLQGYPSESRQTAARRAGRAYRSRLTCPRCGSVFSDPAVYREHLREPHSSDR